MDRNVGICRLCLNVRRFSMTHCKLKFERMPRSVMFVRPDKMDVDPGVAGKLAAGQSSYRKHPGKMTIGAVHPPRQFEKSLILSADETDLKAMTKEAQKFQDYLANRQVPGEPDFLDKKREITLRNAIDKLVESRRKKVKEMTGGSPTDQELYDFVEEQSDALKKTVDTKIRKSTYRWKPIDYKMTSRCLTYALARFPADYSVLCRIFTEIQRKSANFTPASVFDFGSGVGSTVWAVESVWNQKHRFEETRIDVDQEEGSAQPTGRVQFLEENVANSSLKFDGSKTANESAKESASVNSKRTYYCVDASSQMIDLASRLLRGGDPCGQPIFENIQLYFRQFLPALPDPTYDLVVSSFSLMEIPTYEERMRIVLNLWLKTDKFLVIVEQGNRYGFTLLMEIRDYLLSAGREVHRQELRQLLDDRRMDATLVDKILSNKKLNNAQQYQAIKDVLRNTGLEIPTLAPTGFVVAPCPHEFGCPRMMDVLPCKYEQTYFELQLTGSTDQKLNRQPFSYLVLGRGLREDVTKTDPQYDWPRLVRPILPRHRHILCEMCTSQGLLSEATVTRGNAGKDAYRLAYHSQWGDNWPVRLEFTAASFDRQRRSAEKFVEQRKGGVAKKVDDDEDDDEDEDDYEEDDDEESDEVVYFSGRENRSEEGVALKTDFPGI